MIAAKFSFDVRQGYIAAKYVLKSSLEKLRKADASGDGRSHVGSYHIKTVFLHVVEKGSKNKSFSLNSSPYELFSNLLRELDSYIEKGKLPHFFLPQCDLLETVGDEERRLTRQAIENILTVPFDAIIHSPIDAKQIFGDVSKDDLVLAFSRASADPTSELNQKNLSGLLARVDDWRERMGREQLGEVGQASGWVEPIRLVAKLKYWLRNIHTFIVPNSKSS